MGVEESDKLFLMTSTSGIKGSKGGKLGDIGSYTGLGPYSGKTGSG